jgi:hypothetical protein
MEQPKPTSVDVAVKFLASTPGREKSLRLGQYALMLLHNLVARRSWLGARSTEISGHLALCRKVMRFGVPIGKLLAIARRSHTSTSAAFKTLSDIFLIVFLVADHVLYFGRIKVISSEVP